MAVDADDFYNNLNQLLADIIKFLNDEGNLKKLSGDSRLQAETLISRSKHQLQEIAKIKVNDEGEEAYVDMDRRISIEEDEGDGHIYSDVEGPVNNNTVSKFFPKGPYDDLPAAQMSREIKYGRLVLKTKAILFGFEKKRRLFAGIHCDRFILYLSEKDTKPFQVFDLCVCKAEGINKCSKPSQEFLLTTNDAKTYCFIALTHKDMIQWVAHINKFYKTRIENKNKILEENYECVESPSEEIYNTIAETNSNFVLQARPPPQLPDRPRPPVAPQERPISDQSVASYAQVDDTQSQQSDDGSFSTDEDSDETYQEFIPGPPAKILVEKELETVKTPEKPPKLKPKPPVPLAKPSPALLRSRFPSFKKSLDK